MSHPVVSSPPKYENDTLAISFSPTSTGISFDLFNKTDEGMKIEWDELSMSFEGKTYRVLHGGGTLGNITIAQPPSTIPPKSLLSEKIYPVNNISTFKLYSQYYAVLKAWLPTTDANSKKIREQILKRKGERIVIYMPYYLSGKLISAYYNVEIADVKER